MSSCVVVTRHPALVQLLRELGIVGDDVAVMATVTPDDVQGKHVIGMLPLHLAALAERVTTVTLDTPPELRGVELTLEQLRDQFRGVRSYVVKLVE